MRSRFGVAADALLIIVSVGLGAMVLYDRFSPTGRNDHTVRIADQDWSRLLSEKRQIGDPGAAITIVEFVDYQCAFCRAAERIFDAFDSENPGALRRIIKHFPLPQHKSAFRAALASECAHRLGRFDAMHRAIFTNQDSLAGMSSVALAKQARIPDTLQFSNCMELQETRQAVEADLALGAGLGVTGTPMMVHKGRVIETTSGPALRAFLLAELEATAK